MIYSAFAFSRQMQLMLMFVSFATTFLFYSFVTNIILTVYGYRVKLQRKLLFVLLVGTLLNNVWTYGVYFLGGMLSFPPLVYSLVTIPNPVFFLLFYLCGIKVLQLSPYRSLRIIFYAYVYFVAIKYFNRFIGYVFFAQTAGAYNYLLDALSLICCSIINTLLYLATMAYINHNRFLIKQEDRIFIPAIGFEIFRSTMAATFIYCIAVFLPTLFPGSNAIFLVISVFLAYYLSNGVLSDARKAAQADSYHKDAYIKNLSETIESFGSLKHDFTNILQSYEGYLGLNDIDALKKYHNSVLMAARQTGTRMELSSRMSENPPLISLLLSKLTVSSKSFVTMHVDILCDVATVFVNNTDLCRSLDYLLDSAIETAAQSKLRKIFFTVRELPNQRKLIVIRNSTNTTAPAAKEPELLVQAQKILEQFGNCTFNMTRYEDEFVYYIATVELNVQLATSHSS